MQTFEEKLRQKRYELAQLFIDEVGDKPDTFDNWYIIDIKNQLRMIEASMFQFVRDLNEKDGKPTE